MDEAWRAAEAIIDAHNVNDPNNAIVNAIMEAIRDGEDRGAEKAEIYERESNFQRNRAEKAQKDREFYAEWYACRLQRLRKLATDKGFLDEFSDIVANGSTLLDTVPSYAALLNQAKFRAEAAETQRDQMQALGRELIDAMVRYEWAAEGDAPPEHRDLMKRARAALANASPAGASR